VVIDDLDIFRPGIGPHEAEPPLVVDPDAVLSGTVPAELLKSVAGRYSKVCQGFCCVQYGQFAPRNALRGSIESPRSLPVPDGFGVSVLEGSQHT